MNEARELFPLSVPTHEPGFMERVIDCSDLDKIFGVPAKCASIMDVHAALDEKLLDYVVQQTVLDNGNKRIGCMDVWDCWPRKSHPSGGRKVMMTSEYDLADDVVPRFEVYDADGNHRPDVDDFIMQPIKSPSTMAIKNTTIIFLSPAQPDLETG